MIGSASTSSDRSAGGRRPPDAAVEGYCALVVEELHQWGFIGRLEAVHPSWVDVAYTWSRPGSRWATEALAMLEDKGIYQIGRYGRWRFQGIADSIRDGFVAGSSLLSSQPAIPPEPVQARSPTAGHERVA